MVPRARLELARLSTLDPKSSASTNFATSAGCSREASKSESEEYHLMREVTIAHGNLFVQVLFPVVFPRKTVIAFRFDIARG